MKEELLHIKKELSKKLKKERFEHTVSVILYFSHNFNCSFAEQYFPQS